MRQHCPRIHSYSLTILNTYTPVFRSAVRLKMLWQFTVLQKEVNLLFCSFCQCVTQSIHADGNTCTHLHRKQIMRLVSFTSSHLQGQSILPFCLYLCEEQVNTHHCCFSKERKKLEKGAARANGQLQERDASRSHG